MNKKSTKMKFTPADLVHTDGSEVILIMGALVGIKPSFAFSSLRLYSKLYVWI